MYNWDAMQNSNSHTYLNLILSCVSASLAIILFLVFQSQIDSLNHEFPYLITVMFVPAMAIGFLYGIRITERAVNPSVVRSPFRRSIVKTFLFLFVIGGMFSSVNFAINGGSVIPQIPILEGELVSWMHAFIIANGGATFLIIGSIILMASATHRIVGMNGGFLNRMISFVGVFIFFTILALSFTESAVPASSVFLYTFYQAGIVGGAFYTMNKLTKNQNTLNDYANGF